MITLHESNITSFPLDNGIGVLSDAIVAYTEEELNGMFEFYMEYDSEGAFVDELKEERIIKAKAQDKLGYQLFRIYSITKNHENDNIIVNAQHITYDLANHFVEELKANKLTKKQVMEKIGASTAIPHNFNVTSSNTTTISSTSLYRTNPLQMIAGMEGSVLQIWGGQIERDNFNLILHDRRGHDDGVKVSYEKNITGLEATFDISGLVTRIFPYVFIEATDDSPERLITVSGKYIDSPHINDYEVIRTEPIDYSSDERIDTQDKTDAQIRQQLTKVAKDYFKETGNDKIKVEMDVQFAHLWETEEYKDVKVLELVGMGDTVTINHSKLNVDATAIVNYIKYDCIAQVNEEVKLGSVKARLTDSINKIDSIEKKVEQAESHANQAIVSANGKNTTFYGPDEPVEGMKKGDLWFKVIDGQYHKTYRYDGIDWKEILDMDSQEAKEEARQAQERADEAVNRANQATEDANAAIGQAQASFDLAQESLTLGQGLTSRMTDAEGNLTALNQTTQSLAGQLSDVEGNITTLTATVDGLQTTVSDVQGNVSNLTQLSNTLQTRLSDAEGNINELTLTSQSMQSTISSLQDEWDNLEIGGRNLARGTNTDAFVRYGSGVTVSIVEDSPTNTVRVDFVSKVTGGLQQANPYRTMELVEGETYTLSFDVRGKLRGSLNYVYIMHNGTNNQSVSLNESTLSENTFKRVHATFTKRYDAKTSYVMISATSGAVEIGDWFEVKNIQVEKGNKATDWSPAPEDMATQTQITQLSDAINLRVQKGDVLSQINLEAGRTLIDTDKLILSANTTHVTGDFKLDGSAHIKDASIGTAQIGTIDGAIANIINLSANSIVGGILSSQNDNMTLNMNTGRLHMQRVNFSLGNGADIEFLDRGNRIYFLDTKDGTTRSSGFGVGISTLGYPFSYIGTEGSRNLNTLSEYYSGAIFNTTKAISEGASNSISGFRFQFRNKAVDWDKGMTFDWQGSNPSISTFSPTTYDYEIGTFYRLYGKQKFFITNYYNQRSGWMIETAYSGEGRDITLRGTFGTDYNYALGENTPSHRIRNIFLRNNPVVASDERLKEGIKDINIGLDLVKDIDPKSFRLKLTNADINSGISRNKKQFGVIAQQIISVFNKHGFDTSDLSIISGSEEDTYSVQYEQFIPILIKSDQDLDNKITSVKDEVNRLKIENQYLKQKIKLLEEKVA